MKLREVKVKNFRCLVDVTIPLDDLTVLVGENNTGKTAFLEALKIMLTRGSAGRVSPFDEYDYHMSKAGDSPQSSDGIVIELLFREDNPNEWPDSIIQALQDIIQTDPAKDLDSIGVRLSSKYDIMVDQIVPKWEFLTIDGQPLGGKGALTANVPKFLNYVKLFYLSALRNADNEFSSKSQFWGRILRDLKISNEEKKTLGEELSKLNSSLLKADPRLGQVKVTLENIQKIMKAEVGNNTDIQALPLKPWELMSKAEVVIRGRNSEVDFPLSHHGQGMQSLAVLFLFQAYVDVLLKPTFQPETEAILALEEPETHLHPQAVRALAANVCELKSQKIISSHSPFFIQEIPLLRIRLLRRDGAGSKVLYVKRHFSAKIPNEPGIEIFIQQNSPKYEYITGTSTLIVSGKIEQKEYRDLLKIYHERKEVQPILSKLTKESHQYLTDTDISALETYAKRIRGEVFFARSWLLCEGQSEYLLLRYFSELMNKPFDRHGVAVIDYQNNGSPGAFVGLAQAYEIPWILICDDDTAKPGTIKQIEDRGFLKLEMEKLIYPLPEIDLELFLVKNGFIKEYLQILSDHKVSLTKKSGDKGFDEEIASKLRKEKPGYTNDLIRVLRSNNAGESRVPDFFRNIINNMISKAV